MKTINIFAVIRIAVIVTTLIVFLIIPTQSMQNISLCLGYILTNKICAGCGSTRALNNIMHLNFEKAFSLNPVMTLFIFPVIVIVLVWDIWALIKRLKTKNLYLSLLEYIVLKGLS